MNKARRLTYPPMADLVPHEAALRLLDHVVHSEPEHLVCDVTVRSDAAFVEESGVQMVVTLEYMAQCVAAFAGMQARGSGQTVQIGYLIGCRQMTLNGDRIAIGTRLTVACKRVWGDNGLGSFECAVHDGPTCVASALLSVAQPATDSAVS